MNVSMTTQDLNLDMTMDLIKLLDTIPVWNNLLDMIIARKLTLAIDMNNNRTTHNHNNIKKIINIKPHLINKNNNKKKNNHWTNSTQGLNASP